VDDEQIPSNPFRKVAGTAPIPDKDWAYVDEATLDTLFEACPTMGWRLTLALPRLAGLRRGEAWRLQWSDVDLVGRRLTIRNPQSHRSTKKRTRQVPIVPKLYDLLFEAANDESNGEFVIARGSTPQPSHMHRGFGRLCRRAGVEPWARWCHTLRKNCETDWAGQYPIHVVTEWLGNSPVVAMQHYVHATEADFDRLAGNGAPVATISPQSAIGDMAGDS
ncbi:MAG TPA: tyrosine-type recombinase/integrase, partial [Phycisphaerae bacterium]|nr:tyrosine-type recombinase/integrase [Phycisphaerae bacterium]